jgi:Helix-turn-helix domain
MTSEAAKRFEWERIIRRALMDPSTKLVALVLAGYANKDGSSVRPGRKRLSAVTGMSVRTVDRCLDKLRTLGLLDRVSKGSNTGIEFMADVYRLTIPADLLDVVDLLDPKELVRQSSPVSTGQSSPVSTGKGEAVDTQGEAVDTPDYYQSSPQTQPVDTGDYLPVQDHPTTRPKTIAPPCGAATIPPAKACGCVEGWFDHDGGAMPCRVCRPSAYQRFRQRTA